MTQIQKDTRQALLDAACRLFSEHGFDAVSTRMIAETAEVNLGGIHYHFGSKEQLYVAAFQHATATDQRHCLGDVAAMHPELMDTPEGQAEIIRITVKKMFEDFFGSKTIGWKKRIVLRELCSPSSALPILIREIFKPNLEGDVEFIRRVCPDASKHTMVAWANTLHAQIIFYMLTQDSMELMYGERFATQDFYDEVARQQANSLILLMGLPPGPDTGQG
ncbi:MAG: CerR family C-terminal domain-containing protein [Oceanidesulfovibrio sp.]